MLVLVYESDCLHVGPGIRSGMPSIWVFQKDSSPYISEFQKNHKKLRTARLTSATGNWDWHLPSTSNKLYSTKRNYSYRLDRHIKIKSLIFQENSKEKVHKKHSILLTKPQLFIPFWSCSVRDKIDTTSAFLNLFFIHKFL